MGKKIVELPEKGKVVFVGDTHGDFYTTKFIVKSFLDKYILVFLGDYVDRGPYSKENIDFLLSLKEKHDNLILLAGNHEMHPVVECSPSDFWDTLTDEEFNHYKEKFMEFPLCVVGKDIIGLHGVLPEVEKIEDIEDITPGDENWMKIIWGDFRDKEGEEIGDFLGRPKFGKDYFFRVMKNLEKNVLIRSHDPLAPERMFDNRCLTIFTSSAYGRERKIAIVDLEKEIKTIDDIEIISFDQKDIENES
ncbi:serine/threonine protein phosphatase [bacterium]|nr:serine/threonine protein phosphatase [bacterium]